MAKHIITFREKVYDGHAWLSFLMVDSGYWDLSSGAYVARVGERSVEVPKTNVRAIVEVKQEKTA